MFSRQLLNSSRLINRSVSTQAIRCSFRSFSMIRNGGLTNNKLASEVQNRSPLYLNHGISTRRFLSTEMQQSIGEAVKSAPVVLFMKGTPEAPACGFSRATIQLLGSIGVNPDKFAAYNVLEDNELRQGIKEFSDWPTIPQLYVNGEFVGGCDIVTSMAQSGELLEMLEKDGLLVYEEEEADIETPTSSDVKPAKR
ncbi:monothiol glutaredoxin [Saccharomycopsis crataegensis]|uniref:Monothiol glutaredoxin-5, mitochondrial n=1 Tax=Saccharomycopsis crataegensis TaxID=43959 RepID=A0AAV5QTS2_9ASCO|nr:monothiol glutaredoxin [Saccharomycopsis crataegensis]